MEPSLPATAEKLFAPDALPPAVELALPSGTDPWPISPPLGRLLARQVVHDGRRRVLEFGAGSSSRVLGHALAHIGGGQLTSVEQDPQWCAAPWREVADLPGVSAALIPAEVSLAVDRRGCYARYRRDVVRAIHARGPYNLVLVDAPQYWWGRDGALHAAAPSLLPGALVVLDDAGRGAEQRTLACWLRTYEALRLVAHDVDFAGRGVAVLEVTGRLRPRFDWSAWSWSARHAFAAWRMRRRLGSN